MVRKGFLKEDMFQLRPDYESKLSQRRGAVKNVPGKRISTCEVPFKALEEVSYSWVYGVYTSSLKDICQF